VFYIIIYPGYYNHILGCTQANRVEMGPLQNINKVFGILKAMYIWEGERKRRIWEALEGTVYLVRECCM
jgi:hypothetical protein